MAGPSGPAIVVFVIVVFVIVVLVIVVFGRSAVRAAVCVSRG
ncbi:hypothetical protein [Gordonia sp. SID5947]|nr:hypothetical protein [Gordonia sp. SID5947]